MRTWLIAFALVVFIAPPPRGRLGRPQDLKRLSTKQLMPINMTLAS
jgi:hypothetical protein